jgi:hypothetical protein
MGRMSLATPVEGYLEKLFNIVFGFFIEVLLGCL